MFNLFHPSKTAHLKLQAQQLQEARVQLLEHEKAAEFNRAMADMLKARIERLEGQASCKS